MLKYSLDHRFHLHGMNRGALIEKKTVAFVFFLDEWVWDFGEGFRVRHNLFCKLCGLGRGSGQSESRKHHSWREFKHPHHTQVLYQRVGTRGAARSKANEKNNGSKKVHQ